jgi:hypothetical protein
MGSFSTSRATILSTVLLTTRIMATMYFAIRGIYDSMTICEAGTHHTCKLGLGFLEIRLCESPISMVSKQPPASKLKKRVPTLRPCSSECVIQMMALTVEASSFMILCRDLSTSAVVSASKADVGSVAPCIRTGTTWAVEINRPSKSRISAPEMPTAIANAILCDSPPLNLDQGRSQRSSSTPHCSEIFMGANNAPGLIPFLSALARE